MINKKADFSWLELMKPWKSIMASDDPERISKLVPKNIKLSKDPNWNLAAWNVLGVSSWLVPAIIATAVGTNVYWKNKIQKKRKELEISKLNALRYSLKPNENLGYTQNITEDPGKELGDITEQVKLLANSKPENVGALNKQAGDILPTASGSIAAMMPMALAPLTAWYLSKAVNSILSNKYKKELADERVQLQNLQDYVDAQMLKDRGLIAEDNTAPAMNKTASFFGDLAKSISSGWNKTKEVTDELADKTDTFFLKLPARTMLLMAALGTVAGGMYLNRRDDNVKKLKLLTDKMLGENRMSNTSKIDMDLLPGKYTTPSKYKMLQSIQGIPNQIEDAQIVPDSESAKKDALFM